MVYSGTPTTMRDLIRDTRARMSGMLSDELNVLDGAYTPASPAVGDAMTVRLRYESRGLAPGVTMCCEENTWYVVATTPLTREAQVLPSYDDSPDVAKPAGSIVRVQPRFSDWAIFRALVDQIALMSSSTQGLYRLASVSMPRSTDPTTGYVLPDNADRLRSVYGFNIDRWYNLGRWDVVGGQVFLFDQPGTEFTFVYAYDFVLPTSFDSDLYVDVGLSPTMVDIPPLGAAGTLLLGKEVRRVAPEPQGDSRRAEETMPGANTGISRELLRMRDSRMRDEYARLLNQAPYVMAR